MSRLLPWVLGLGFLALYTSYLLASASDIRTPPDTPPNVETQEEEPTLQLCPPPDTSARRNSNVLLVSTLDGQIAALDPNNEGEMLWSLPTKPGHMLSSTISHMEMTSNAKWVRLIPSLAGGLYKFDGEMVEPVPLSAETLLRNSFRFNDDTVITGGKDSRTYGVEMDTGKLRYECSVDGCQNFIEGQDDLEDVIVIKRETQTVRAVEPRTGTEKWNFSVSQHNLQFHAGMESFCDDSDKEEVKEDEDVEIKAVVPDGVICAVDKGHPEKIVWSFKFDTPIVHAWRVVNGRLIKVNLFSTSAIPERLPSLDDDGGVTTPLLYIGSHNKQLYIQESDRLHASTENFAANPEAQFPRVTFKPYLISADSRTPIINHGRPAGELPLLTYDKASAESTALAVFTGSEYPFDSGLYLYPDEPNLEYDPLNVTINPDEEDDDSTRNTVIHIVFLNSFGYYWKEVAIISILTAIAMNIVITHEQRVYFKRKINELMHRRPNIVFIERRVEVPVTIEVEVPVPSSPDTAGSGSSLEFPSGSGDAANNGEFVSRFLMDYDPVQCLGRGGFGVVFESKNKIDDINYAVKRIRLPISESAKKKVMREVKFLAKLDHKNIVRYFNTWLEYPPPGWQDEKDKWWLDSEVVTGPTPLNTVEESSTGISKNSSSAFYRRNKSKSNPLKLECGGSIGFGYSESGTSDRYDLSRSCDDSAIVFENSDSKLTDEGNVSDEGEDCDNDGDESSGGIVFENTESAPKSADKKVISFLPPSHSLATWATSESEEEAVDALDWDEKNLKDKKDTKPRAYLYIVMQLCQKESLRDWLRSCTIQRNRAKALYMFHEICSGVEYVHQQGLIHRDLKPNNIFFSHDGTIKIGDFGLVTGTSDEQSELLAHVNSDLQRQKSDEQQQHTDQVGTALYMSPEQLARRPYNYKVDIYSLGIILFELLVPFSTQMERVDTLSGLRKLKFPSHFLNYEEYGLVSRMLSHDPSERPDADEIIGFEMIQAAVEKFEGESHRNRRRLNTSESLPD